MLLRKRTIIAASLSLIIFSSSISVLLGIGETPKTFMGSEEDYVISDSRTTSVINSRIDLILSDRLLDLGIVDIASPEVFAFAEIGGSAVVIRGVNFTSLSIIEGYQFVEGTQPDEFEFSKALIGSRLANRIGIAVGDRIPLVGSFRPSVAEVEISGIITSGLSLDDELLVSLAIAQSLSGMPSTQVSVLRVRGDIETLEAIFAPNTARFSIFDLNFPFKEISLNETMEIGIWLKNWGDEEGTPDLRIIDETTNETLLWNQTILSAGEKVELTANFSSWVEGEHEITAYLGGPLPQTISANLTVEGPRLSLVLPEFVAEYHNFTVRVYNDAFKLIRNATISVEGYEYTTDSLGLALIDAPLSPGIYNISAVSPGYPKESEEFEVVPSGDLPPEAVVEAYDLILDPEIVKVRENCTVEIYVHNRGNATGVARINLTIDGNIYESANIQLTPLKATVIYFNISFQSSGDRLFASGSIAKTLSVESTFQINPELVQLLLRYGEAGSINPSRGNLIYNTAKISESNILIVLVSMGILSGTLVTMGISISFMKEINDNMRTIGILRSIGASSRQLMGMIFRESIMLSLPATVIGLLGGITLSLMISSSGNLIAFGHVIEPSLDPTFLTLAVLGSIAICVGSSLIAGLSVTRKVAIRMIRGLHEDITDQPTLEELLRE